ncbi:hypothetical protein J6590_073743 [Homalodisca vitripennis]|nr:hypothetical protein J6590_073743 [Homalodisca vitripennis]
MRDLEQLDNEPDQGKVGRLLLAVLTQKPRSIWRSRPRGFSPFEEIQLNMGPAKKPGQDFKGQPSSPRTSRWTASKSCSKPSKIRMTFKRTNGLFLEGKLAPRSNS